jgi:hypothetical protein
LNGYIKFNPRIFTLEPGASQLVRFTVAAPKSGFAGELRGMVFFEEETPLSDGGVHAKLITEVGSTIYAAIDPIQLKLQLASVKVVEVNGRISAALNIRNEGSSHVRYRIAYKVVNAKNALIAQDQVQEKILLPGFQREISFPVTGDFPIGKYRLWLEIKFFNTDKTLVHAIPFTIEKQ